jgi:hypothetical protein
MSSVWTTIDLEGVMVTVRVRVRRGVRIVRRLQKWLAETDSW